uniref:Uncharacterized protein n=1 Tax=Haptolina ericina TaxID=156174 RepID=A0A6T9PZM4_9EUKA|mmetsp:Transcript_9327/g.21016  ORF Transcript_9327/g.21016 Transcript_9327/m.21016 type:complete len:193 (+) Transcript_9327:3-581(+)
MDWYCSKRLVEGGQADGFCKRNDLLKKLRTASTDAERQEILPQLRALPPPAFGTAQAIYADFCKLKPNIESTFCLSTRRTAESKRMNRWYCGQEQHKDGLWCRRTALLDQIQKLPPPQPGSPPSDERKALSQKMSAMMAPNGGPSPSKSLSEEISAAKKAYCAAAVSEEKSYCQDDVLASGHTAIDMHKFTG